MAKSTYSKIRELGRGSFGLVDLVQDTNGHQWARKTFAPPNLVGIDPADLRARFEREVRYQSQIDHPNVARIVDFDLNVDPPWFIMELAEGTLADALTLDRTLGGSPRAPLFDVLAGLEALHERGFKHRDLKPANILRMRDSAGSARYAISDFGLMSPASGQTSTLTTSNMVGGTPHYSAPECAISFKRATIQSDIYSVGAILHDIFGGGTSRIPYTELHVNGPVGPIVEKCTKTNVRRRYKDVAALREDLYSALSQEQVAFASKEEEEIVKLLEKSDSLTPEEWDRVFILIDENDDKNRTNHGVFRVITLGHLDHLAEKEPELFAALGEDYAVYAQEGTFNFDYCDVIGDKAQVFFDKGELDLKARIAVALMQLGTSHNRWFVEHKFMKMAGIEASEALADRIRIEMEVQKIDFGRQFRHIQGSISVGESDLHPVLRKVLEEELDED